MQVLKIATVCCAVWFLWGCSSASAPPPARTVFDPLTNDLERARGVQKTVDANSDGTRRAVDAQERGDNTP